MYCILPIRGGLFRVTVTRSPEFPSVYEAHCPDFPDLYEYADSEAEALALIADSIEVTLDYLKEKVRV